MSEPRINTTRSASVAGTPSRNHVSSSSRQELPVSPSTDSKIFKAPTGLDASQLRSPERRVNCPSRTLASTDWTCRRIRASTRSSRSSRGRWRRPLDSDRSRQALEIHRAAFMACLCSLIWADEKKEVRSPVWSGKMEETIGDGKMLRIYTGWHSHVMTRFVKCRLKRLERWAACMVVFVNTIPFAKQCTSNFNTFPS